MTIRIARIWCVVWLGALMISGCGLGSQAHATPALVSLVLARAVNADYSPLQPTDSFTPTDVFHVAAQMTNLSSGTRLSARWYYAGNLITESPFNAEQGGSGWVAFQLSRPTPWPVGDYRVDLVMDERVLGHTPFAVRLAP